LCRQIILTVTHKRKPATNALDYFKHCARYASPFYLLTVSYQNAVNKTTCIGVLMQTKQPTQRAIVLYSTHQTAAESTAL